MFIFALPSSFGHKDMVENFWETYTKLEDKTSKSTKVVEELVPKIVLFPHEVFTLNFMCFHTKIKGGNQWFFGCTQTLKRESQDA